MRKVILKIQETLRYQREVPVEIPDDMDEKSFNAVLDRAQRGAGSADDIVFNLRLSGIQQSESYDDSLDSPWDSEAECDDYEFSEQ